MQQEEDIVYEEDEGVEHVDDILVALQAAQGSLDWAPPTTTQAPEGRGAPPAAPGGGSGAYSMSTAALLASVGGGEESSDWESSEDEAGAEPGEAREAVDRCDHPCGALFCFIKFTKHDLCPYA